MPTTVRVGNLDMVIHLLPDLVTTPDAWMEVILTIGVIVLPLANVDHSRDSRQSRNEHPRGPRLLNFGMVDYHPYPLGQMITKAYETETETETETENANWAIGDHPIGHRQEEEAARIAEAHGVSITDIATHITRRTECYYPQQQF